MKVNRSSTWILCTLSLLTLCSAAQADVFGLPGGDGSSGTPGNRGNDGQSVEVIASGSAQTLNLRGQDGSPGSNGSNAGNADRCGQPVGVRADFFGARGGIGGDAGPGGNGGNGGVATLYYTDPLQLKNILIDASPGQGEPAGLPGQGGNACTCAVYHWEVPVHECHTVNPPHAEFKSNAVATRVTAAETGDRNPPPGTPDQGHAVPRPQPSNQPQPPQQPPAPPQVVCTDTREAHDCRDGENGRPGNAAPNGNSGQIGSVILIQNAGPLSPAQPVETATISSLPAQATLSYDNWATNVGALQLLAPGSQVSDSYQYWAGRKTIPVSISWNAQSARSQFTAYQLQVQTDTSGQVSSRLLTNDMWAEISVNSDPSGSARVSVDKAVLASQTTELSAQIYGCGDGTIAQISDAANVSDIVNTQVHAKVISSGIFDHTRYDDNVPANLLSVTRSNITVDIGKLNGIPSGDIAQGKDLKVELTITRSLGDGSANQQINLEQKKLCSQ